jgi:hypothetical protein
VVHDLAEGPGHQILVGSGGHIGGRTRAGGGSGQRSISLTYLPGINTLCAKKPRVPAPRQAS